LSECIAEVRKCALVCSNCHAGVHAGHCLIPCGWDYIDEEKVKALLDEQEKKVHKCELCGKEIWQSSKHCKLCSSKQMRKLEHPSREQLKDLIRKMPFLEIGKLFGVSDKAITKWCKHESLPYKKSEIKSISDEMWMNI
jgi:hypothetical protein